MFIKRLKKIVKRIYHSTGANVYSQMVSVHIYSFNMSLWSYVVGTRYMIVDCGGGTTDITVHEVDSYGYLKEITRACGGPYGSLGRLIICYLTFAIL